MCGAILNAEFTARLARAILRMCDRVCDRALCARVYDRARDRARDFTSLVSRSGAASPGGRLGASRQARQGRGSTPRGARVRGSRGVVLLGVLVVCSGTSGVVSCGVWDAPREGFRTASGGVSRRDATGCAGVFSSRAGRGVFGVFCGVFGPRRAGVLRAA